MSRCPEQPERQSSPFFKYWSQRPITIINSFPCGIIFPETQVNKEQSSLLAQIEVELGKRGFSPTLWRNPGTERLKEQPNFEIKVNDHLFNVLLLNELSPNLLYKYGILKGEGKPVILLQSKTASLPVKSLYASEADSGLASNLFNNNFLDPIIDLPYLLPGLVVDYLGIIDVEATANDPSHSSIVLREALAKTGCFVTETLKKRLLHQFPDECMEEIHPLLEIFFEFCDTLSSGAKFTQTTNLRTIYSSLQKLAQQYHFAIPFEVAKLLIASFVFQAIQCGDEQTEKHAYLQLALQISRDLLDAIEDLNQRALLSKEIGAICTELFLIDGSIESLQAAEQAHDEALRTYSYEHHPVEFGMILNNQGVIHLGKAIYFNSSDDLKYASAAFENAQRALKTISISQHYQITQFNLGLTLATRAGWESDFGLLRQALLEFEEAANISEADPVLLARIHQNRGRLYWNLTASEQNYDTYRNTINAFQKVIGLPSSGLCSEELGLAWVSIGEAALKIATHHDPADSNYKQAIHAYLEYFKVYKANDSQEWGEAAKGLADAYFGLANCESNIIYYHSAISTYMEALKVLNADSSPENYIAIQNTLAMIYRILAQFENASENYHKAIDAYHEVLKVASPEDALHQAKVNLELGGLYSDLALIEDLEINNQAANTAYRNVIDIITSKSSIENCLEFYIKAQLGLGKTFINMAAVTKTTTNYHQALTVFEDIPQLCTSELLSVYQGEVELQIGTVSRNLALLEADPLPYCKKAENAYCKALSIYTLDTDQCHFSKIQTGLGDIYGILAELDNQKHYYNLGISAYLDALKAELPPIEAAAIRQKRGDLLLKLAAIEETVINCQAALRDYDSALLDYDSGKFQQAYALIQKGRGDVFQKLAGVENGLDNSRQAITAYQEALQILTIEKSPLEYAAVQRELGTTYLNLFQLEQDPVNCRNAAQAFRLALAAYIKEECPEEYATIRNLLGNAYLILAEREKSVEDYNKAVESFEEVVKLYSDGTLPQEFVAVQINLGLAYTNLAAVRGASEDYQKAVGVYEKALNGEKLKDSSFEYNMVFLKMGDAYLKLAELNHDYEACQKAITAYEEALKVFTLDDYPMLFASTQKNITCVYRILCLLERKPIHFIKAFLAFKEALQVYTPAMPLLYAGLQRDMGDFYFNWAELENQVENYSSSAASYQQALTVWTFKDDPIQYGETQNRLARTYAKLSELKNPEVYCRKAIQAYEEALPTGEAEDSSPRVSLIQEGLGDMFQKLAKIEGNIDLCQKALLAYEKASAVFDNANPLPKLVLKDKIGDCYRIAAELAEPLFNYKKAISSYQEIVANLDSVSSPLDPAAVFIKLGRISEQVAVLEDNFLLYQQALDYYLDSLPLISKEPRRSAAVYQNIAGIYLKLSETGEPLTNSLKSVQMYQQALDFYANNDLPYELGMVQAALGTAYQKLAEFDEKAENSRKAIEMFSSAVKVLNNRDYPREFTCIQYKMGNVYFALAEVLDPTECFQQALNFYETALPGLTEFDYQREYLSALQNMGLVHLRLLKPTVTDSEENLTKSISLFQRLLTLTDKEQFPLDYASYQTALGYRLVRLATLKNATDNYQQAVIAYNAALVIYTQLRLSTETAQTQKALADIYHELASIAKTDDLARESVFWYQAALPHFIKTAPYEAALLHQKLGMVLAILFEFTRDISILKEGIAALEQAIIVYQELEPEKSILLDPKFLSSTRLRLGDLLAKLAKLEKEGQEAHLKEAVSYYESVIQIIRLGEIQPESTLWRKLGEVYLELAECLFSAPSVIHYSQAALTAFEEAWSQEPIAEILYLSGRGYYRLAQYDESLVNGKKAIVAFEESLQLNNMDRQTPRWAEIQYWMGNAYSLCGTVTDGQINYQSAVECYQAALTVRTFEYLPLEYGITHRELGKALQALAGLIAPTFNYQLAIESFNEAVRTFTRENYPLEYVECQRHLGVTQHLLAELENSSVHEVNAIEAYHNALSVLESQTAHPEYAKCHSGLGNIHLKLALNGDTVENCQKAIDSYQKAQTAGMESPQQLAELDEHLGIAYRLLWETNNQVEYREKALNALSLAIQQYRQADLMVPFALTQQQIGLIYQKLAASSDNPEYWKTAIEAFREALRVLNSHSHPEHYASSQAKMGDAYLGLAELENPVINYNRAIKAYQATLTIWTGERFPSEYILVRQNLGLAYERLAEFDNRAGNLQLGLETYREALKVQSISDSPAEYALLQKKCGILLNILAEVCGHSSDCQEAISAFEEALRVYSKENFPLDYAEVMYHLGNSHRLLAELDQQVQNCRKAIDHYETAIGIFNSREDSQNTEDYAMLQHNLGNAYLMLSNLKETEEYSGKAAAAFGNALMYFNLKAHPKEYAIIQGKTGKALQGLAKITRSQTDYYNAIAAYQETLKVYTTHSYPNQYANFQLSLGTIYHELAGINAPLENLPKAVSSYLAALKIFRIKDPAEAGSVQHQLGLAYSALADLENKSINCKLALEAFEEALKIKSSASTSSQTITSWYERGRVFQKIAVSEEASANYQQSILCFEEALALAKSSDIPSQARALIQKALGDSLFSLAKIKPKIETLRKAMESYQSALEVFTGNGVWIECGAIHKNLGNIYIKLARFGNKRDNCKNAVISCQEALKIYTPEGNLPDFIAIMHDLGDGYRLLAETDGETANYQKAIEAFEKILAVSPVDSELVKIQTKLGAIYRTLAKSEEFIDNNKKAFQYFEKALKIASQKRLEAEQLNIQFNIGCLYFDFAGSGSTNPIRGQNYKKAVQMFREIIKTTSIDYRPNQYAASQNELGKTYFRLADLEKNNEYLRLALNCFTEALKVRILETYPLQYAETQMNIGGVYYCLAGDLNYQMAIEAYQKASHVYFQKNLLGDYAKAHYEMGKIFGLIAEIESNPEMLREAIKCFEEVFKAGSAKGQPVEVGDAKLQLGHSFLKLGQFETSQEHYQTAINNYFEAAALYLKLDLTERYQLTQHSLGNAYHHLARNSGRIENYKNALHAYEDTLNFISKETAPLQYALVQKDLGELYESLASLGYETDYYTKAVNSYHEGLSRLTDQDQYFDLLQQRLGKVYLKLASVNDPLTYVGKAIEAFKRALQTSSNWHSPQRSASLWSNLGESYAFLAKISKNSGNWKKAIAAYREALKNQSEDSVNFNCSHVQLKLGQALFALAEYEDQIENCKSALYINQEVFRGINSPTLLPEHGEALNQMGCAYYVLAVAETFKSGDQLPKLAYEELATSTDFGKIPEWYTIARSDPESDSISLAKVEEKSWNCRQAMDMFHKALEIYSLEQHPQTYASIRLNLGNVYLAYYETDYNLSNLENAIYAYQEAAELWNHQNEPLVYANCMNCLGNAYQRMARFEAKVENSKRAIEAYETALKICTYERFPLNYGIFQNNIKNACYLWAEEENNVDTYKKVFEACEEALKVFTKRKFPKMYRLLKYEIDNLVNLLID